MARPATLTTADRAFIVKAYLAGATQYELADRFNVTQTSISRVCKAHGAKRVKPKFDFSNI